MSRTLAHSTRPAANINAYLEDVGLLNEKTKVGPKKLRDGRAKFDKARMLQKKAKLMRSGIRDCSGMRKNKG